MVRVEPAPVVPHFQRKLARTVLQLNRQILRAGVFLHIMDCLLRHAQNLALRSPAA